MPETTLEKIYLSSIKFLAPLSLEKTYSTIVQEAAKLVKAQWGSVLLEQNGELKRVYSSIPLKRQIKHRKRGFLYRSFKTDKPIALSAKQIAKVHPEIEELAITSDVIIPLSSQNKSIGILSVLTKREQSFTGKEINTLILFGSLASLAIRKAQLYDDTKRDLETRDLFISMAGHEIKTPITTIFGYTQLLFNNFHQGKKLKGEWIDSLFAECDRLKSLVNDFLEIGHIKKGSLHYNLKEYSIKAIANQAINNFSFNYSHRDLILKDYISTNKDTAVVDHDRLMQVLINLLDNAAKYSPPDRKIMLILKSDQLNFIIQIKDQGIGIAKKDLPKIFNRYYRKSGDSHRGLGLGLFIVKNIIEYHHGSINLHSQLHKGTTVEIKLPRIKI